jgi:peptidoglycan/xylan/chitin deacetylase (PgdA/CDA1 family)
MSFGLPFGRGDAVTLAIDDGPSDVTGQLLAQLEKGGHRAVLFVLGCNVAGREAMLVDAIRRGFALGNHSFTHPYFSTIEVTQARQEIAATEALITAAYARARVRRPGRWFRFPYLDTGGANFSAFQSLLAEFGFERPRALRRRLLDEWRQRLDWPTTLNTQDWALPDEAALRRTLRQAIRGDVIEFHDKLATVPRYGPIVVEELARLSLCATVPTSLLGVLG